MAWKSIDKDDILSILAYQKTLSNMDIERQETEIINLGEAMSNETKKSLKRNLPKAIKAGIITKKEYEKEYEGKYLDEYDIDGFSGVLDVALMKQQYKTVVTSCKQLLKDAKKIKKRFNVRIISSEQFIKEIKKTEKEMMKNGKSKL